MKRTPAGLHRLKINTVIIALCACVPTLARAQNEKPADDGKTYSWTYKYRKGRISHSVAKVKMNGSLSNGVGLEMVMKGKAREEVKGVADNGDATIVEKNEELEMTVNGNSVPNPAVGSITTAVFSSNGLVLKRERSVAVQEGSEILQKLDRILLAQPAPPMPVKIGETWTTDLDNPLLEGKKVTFTSKLTGKERIQGVEALAVEVQVDVPTKEGAEATDIVKLSGTYYLDPAQGRHLKLNYLVENLKLSGPQLPDPVRFDLEVESVTTYDTGAKKPAARPKTATRKKKRSALLPTLGVKG